MPVYCEGKERRNINGAAVEDSKNGLRGLQQCSVSCQLVLATTNKQKKILLCKYYNTFHAACKEFSDISSVQNLTTELSKLTN